MAQISKKGLASNAVDGSKIKLDNAQYLKGRNAANSADVNIIKVNASDQVELSAIPYVGANYLLDSSLLGANSGVATLDGGGKIPSSQLPNSVMDYKGNWNASTNSPTLADGTGSAGDVYRANVAGTQDLGSGSQTFAVGDWVVYNGSIWELSANSNAVTSVNSQTGAVTVNAINELTGDVTAGPASGSQSKAATIASGAVTGSKIASDTITNSNINSAAAIAYSKLNLSGSIVNADVNSSAAIAYSKLNLSGSIVDADVASGAAIAVNKLAAVTASKALQSDASGFVSASSVTSTELGYVSGVTSSIQTQLNGKLSSLSSGAESLTLTGTDITNQYVDLAQTVYNGSLKIECYGVVQVQGVDYTLSIASGKTRVTFAGDLATGGNAALASGDVVYAQYLY